MIHWETGFRRLGWVLIGVGTTVVAILAVDFSYRGPCFDEDSISQYVYTKRELVRDWYSIDPVTESSQIVRGTIHIGGLLEKLPLRVVSQIFKYLENLESVKGIVDLLQKESENRLEKNQTGDLASLRERGYFPELSLVMTPRHFDPYRYLQWVLGTFLASTVIVQGLISVARWVLLGFRGRETAQ